MALISTISTIVSDPLISVTMGNNGIMTIEVSDPLKSGMITIEISDPLMSGMITIEISDPLMSGIVTHTEISLPPKSMIIIELSK
jgi:phage-related protein